MPVNVVRRAIEQSGNREPLVRAMALLCGARVLAAADTELAKGAFDEGVKIAEGLPLDVRHRELVLEEAVRLGTTADPLSAVALFRRLSSAEHIDRRFRCRHKP